MSRIDQFESLFKSAARTPFRHQRVNLSKILVVSDLGEKDAWELGARLKAMWTMLGDDVTWVDAAEERGRTVGELLEVVEEEKADLIVTYRSLYSESWRWPNSLGEHLDVLTQATTTPVLVMPRPDREILCPKRKCREDSVDLAVRPEIMTTPRDTAKSCVRSQITRSAPLTPALVMASVAAIEEASRRASPEQRAVAPEAPPEVSVPERRGSDSQ